MSLPTPAEILERRYQLFDVEILLNQFTEEGIYNLDIEALKVVAQALAKQAKEQLMEVCGWLEEMNDEADARESAAEAIVTPKAGLMER